MSPTQGSFSASESPPTVDDQALGRILLTLRTQLLERRMYPIDSMIYVSSDGGPLGTRTELSERLAKINTLPCQAGGETLHGPGVKVTFMPSDSDEVMQVEVTSTGPLEREIAELSFERIEIVFPSWVRSFDPAGDEVSEDTEEFFQIDEFLDD